MEQVKLAVDMKMRGSLNPVVRSVCWDNEQLHLLVGTLGNEIYELNTNDGSNLHGNEPLLQVPSSWESVVVSDEQANSLTHFRLPFPSGTLYHRVVGSLPSSHRS